MIVKADQKGEYILFIENGVEVYDIRLKGATQAEIRRRILHLTEKFWCTDRVRREAERIADEYFAGEQAYSGAA